MTTPPLAAPALDQHMQAAAQWHQQGQIERAAEAYRAVLAQQPRHTQALQMLGVAEMQLGHAELAVQVLRSLVHLTPHDADTLCNLGSALEMQGALANLHVHLDADLLEQGVDAL